MIGKVLLAATRFLEEVATRSPDAVAALTLAGVEEGQFEVLADAVTRQLKQSLSSDAPAYAGAR
jgi:hypothetical protein